MGEDDGKPIFQLKSPLQLNLTLKKRPQFKKCKKISSISGIYGDCLGFFCTNSVIFGQNPRFLFFDRSQKSHTLLASSFIQILNQFYSKNGFPVYVEYSKFLKKTTYFMCIMILHSLTQCSVYRLVHKSFIILVKSVVSTSNCFGK